MAHVLSMTGFGHGESVAGSFRFSCDVRSVNHRFLDVQVRLPRDLAALEPDLVRAVKGRVERGRVEVLIRVETGSASAHELVVDGELAREYARGLRQLAAVLGCPDPEPTPRDLAAMDGVFVLRPRAPGEGAGPAVAEALEGALDAHHAMRRDEGAALARDLHGQLESIDGALIRVRRDAEDQLDRLHERLRQRLEALLASVDVALEPDRVLTEAALLAERSDIHEEIVRLEQHVRAFRRELEEGGRVGRKLDFLAQEMLREANTMGSKSGEATLSHLVVGIKNDVERIREQVQNIE